VTIADTLNSSVRVLAALGWLKQLKLAGHWLEQYTAPVRAKPDSRPHLEGERYKNSTSCSHLLNPLFPACHAYTSHTRTNSPPFPGQLHWTTMTTIYFSASEDFLDFALYKCSHYITLHYIWSRL